MHNALDHVAHTKNKPAIVSELRNILQASDAPSAQVSLSQFIQKWSPLESRFCDWAETNIPEGFNVLTLDIRIRKSLRTSNLIERMNQEIKRRTRVARIFPNEASCLRLVTAVLLEIHESWISERRLFSFNHSEPVDSIYRKNVA
jgi:putative transposase